MLFIAITVGFLTCGKTRVIVDWHNYGFSIMQVGGSSKTFVKIAKMYETLIGKFGWQHLTVSNAMKSNLAILTGIQLNRI